MIRCTRCGRILAKPAAELRFGNTVAHYGPACAVRAGLIAVPARRRAMRARRVRSDGRQMVLDVGQAARP